MVKLFAEVYTRQRHVKIEHLPFCGVAGVRPVCINKARTPTKDGLLQVHGASWNVRTYDDHHRAQSGTIGHERPLVEPSATIGKKKNSTLCEKRGVIELHVS
jgi:hypothetical protein